MKPIRLFFGLALACLGLSQLVTPVSAADPPWPPAVLVLALDPSAAEENCDPATFLVVRTGPADAPLTVQYTLGGTAENGTDYASLPGHVTIPSGAWFAPVTIEPIDDFLVEGSESVVLALLQPPEWPPPYWVAWPSVALAEIEDNDLPPTNYPPQVKLVRPPEGAIFEAGIDIPLVARAFDADGRVTTVEFFDGTTSLGIVTNRPILASPVATMNPAADPVFDLDPDVFADTEMNLDGPVPLPGQFFRLVWSDPTLGPHTLTALATDNDGATTRSLPVHITVLECPPQPVVTIRATDPLAAEPSPTGPAIDTATFRVHRTGPTNLPLEVYYRLGGTAINGVDYKELPRVVKIPAGSRVAEIIVEPLDDLLFEGPETVVATVVAPICIDVFPPPPDCYRVGLAHTARAVIRDNDSPPNRPPLVRLVKPEDGAIFLASADIRLVALAQDFDGWVTTVEFFEGTNSLGVVSNMSTATRVGAPVFSLVWSNVPPGEYVLTAVATDNDGAFTQSRPVEIRVVPQVVPPVVNLLTLDREASEAPASGIPDPAVFSVTRTGPTDQSLLVFYSIGGTASNGIDYRELPGRILIPSGSSSNLIVIQPLDDNLVEGLETVSLRLEPPPIMTPLPTTLNWWYRIGSNSCGLAVIRDKDAPPTNSPPRVALVQPEEGEVFIAPTDIKLVALAHDSDGWVRTVEFFDGDHSLAVVSNSLSGFGTNVTGLCPEQLFSWVWKESPVGPHVLTAKATDNRGGSTVSGPVHIRVLGPRPPVVTISAADPFGAEGNPRPVNSNTDCVPKPAIFVVNRSGGTNFDLTVYYKLSGTAENGIDYRQLPDHVTIPRGEFCAKIVVEPIDDLLPEPTETVVATLQPVACLPVEPPPPGCYIVGDPSAAVVYILDNDFNRPPKAEIVHPADGSIFPALSDIEIDVLACDPDGWVGKVQFYAGTNLIGEREMIFIVPPPPGQVQKFSMTWSNVLAGDYVLTAKAIDNLGAASVSDPVRIHVRTLPPVPVVTIRAVDPVAAEPNPLLPVEPDTALFKVFRKGDLSRDVTVFYRCCGTATNGVDYRELSGQVVIPATSDSAPIEVIPLHDTLVEGTESVIISLVQPPCLTSNVVSMECYVVGQPGRDIAYILDNDGPPNRPPTVAIVSPPNGAVFSAPVDLRLVAAAGDPDGWVTTVEFFDGTVSLGVVSNRAWVVETPPVRLPGVATDVFGDHDCLWPFVLLWKNVPPGKHVLTAVATDNTGGSARSRPVEIAVLETGNVPTVNIMAVDAVAREGTTNTAAFRVRRIGPTNETLTVFYTVRGTASNGVDYVEIPGWVSIAAGRHSARILIEPIDDRLREGIETVGLRLRTPPVGPDTYVIGRPAAAAAIILDNDWPLLNSEILLGGNLHLRLPLPVGMPFRLETSADLETWEPVVDGIATETGVSFVDEDMNGVSQRFFRVIQEYGDLADD